MPPLFCPAPADFFWRSSPESLKSHCLQPLHFFAFLGLLLAGLGAVAVALVVGILLAVAALVTLLTLEVLRDPPVERVEVADVVFRRRHVRAPCSPARHCRIWCQVCKMCKSAATQRP